MNTVRATRFDRLPGRLRGAAALVTLALAVIEAPGEVVAIQGAVRAQVQAIDHTRSGRRSGDAHEARAQSPPTPTPLDVLARLEVSEGRAAGAASARLDGFIRATADAEPSLSVALDSRAATVSYTAVAEHEELRSLRFTPAELPATWTGEPVLLTGALVLDGIVAFFADAGRNDGRSADLDGLSATVHVKVENLTDIGPLPLYEGSLTVAGAARGAARLEATGGLLGVEVRELDLLAPAETPAASDGGLAAAPALPGDWGAFRAVVLPRVRIEYKYLATVGWSLTLRTTVRMEAANAPAGTGVIAMLGAADEPLERVLACTRDGATATSVRDALQSARVHEQGAFTRAAPPLPNACGAFGFEALAAVAACASGRRLARARSPGPRRSERTVPQ